MKYSIGAQVIVSKDELDGLEIRKRSKRLDTKNSDEYVKMCKELNNEFNNHVKESLAKVIAHHIIEHYNDIPFDINEWSVGLDKQFTTKINIEC